MVTILIIIAIVILVYRSDRKVTCPKCGRKTGISTGKIIEKNGRQAFKGYKCKCGEVWYEKI